MRVALSLRCTSSQVMARLRTSFWEVIAISIAVFVMLQYEVPKNAGGERMPLWRQEVGVFLEERLGLVTFLRDKLSPRAEPPVEEVIPGAPAIEDGGRGLVGGGEREGAPSNASLAQARESPQGKHEVLGLLSIASPGGSEAGAGDQGSADAADAVVTTSAEGPQRAGPVAMPCDADAPGPRVVQQGGESTIVPDPGRLVGDADPVGVGSSPSSVSQQGPSAQADPPSPGPAPRFLEPPFGFWEMLAPAAALPAPAEAATPSESATPTAAALPTATSADDGPESRTIVGRGPEGGAGDQEGADAANAVAANSSPGPHGAEGPQRAGPAAMPKDADVSGPRVVQQGGEAPIVLDPRLAGDADPAGIDSSSSPVSQQGPGPVVGPSAHAANSSREPVARFADASPPTSRAAQASHDDSGPAGQAVLTSSDAPPVDPASPGPAPRFLEPPFGFWEMLAPAAALPAPAEADTPSEADPPTAAAPAIATSGEDSPKSPAPSAEEARDSVVTSQPGSPPVDALADGGAAVVPRGPSAAAQARDDDHGDDALASPPHPEEVHAPSGPSGGHRWGVWEALTGRKGGAGGAPPVDAVSSEPGGDEGQDRVGNFPPDAHRPERLEGEGDVTAASLSSPADGPTSDPAARRSVDEPVAGTPSEAAIPTAASPPTATSGEDSPESYNLIVDESGDPIVTSELASPPADAPADAGAAVVPEDPSAPAQAREGGHSDDFLGLLSPGGAPSQPIPEEVRSTSGRSGGPLPRWRVWEALTGRKGAGGAPPLLDPVPSEQGNYIGEEQVGHSPGDADQPEPSGGEGDATDASLSPPADGPTPDPETPLTETPGVVDEPPTQVRAGVDEGGPRGLWRSGDRSPDAFAALARALGVFREPPSPPSPRTPGGNVEHEVVRTEDEESNALSAPHAEEEPISYEEEPRVEAPAGAGGKAEAEAQADSLAPSLLPPLQTPPTDGSGASVDGGAGGGISLPGSSVEDALVSSESVQLPHSAERSEAMPGAGEASSSQSQGLASPTSADPPPPARPPSLETLQCWLGWCPYQGAVGSSRPAGETSPRPLAAGGGIADHREAQGPTPPEALPETLPADDSTTPERAAMPAEGTPEAPGGVVPPAVPPADLQAEAGAGASGRTREDARSPAPAPADAGVTSSEGAPARRRRRGRKAPTEVTRRAQMTSLGRIIVSAPGRPWHTRQCTD
jgi:hypothetical protein